MAFASPAHANDLEQIVEDQARRIEQLEANQRRLDERLEAKEGNPPPIGERRCRRDTGVHRRGLRRPANRGLRAGSMMF